jgi:hydroxymethylglutaryl-CoA lyase
MSAAIDVTICEVGPRDGLQMAKGRMPTEAKKAWIKAIFEAGVKEIEVCSFVPPKVVPAMFDAQEVCEYAATIPGLTVCVLAPNLKGAERAVEAGAHVIGMPISVSRSHALANIRMTPEQAVDQVRQVVALRDSLPADKRFRLCGGLATALGCTMEGNVPVADVVRMAVLLAEAGVDDISIADTVGYANPGQVKTLVRAVRREVGDRLSTLHLHDTRGLALANAFAGFEEGIRTFDGCVGGLGGCPFAPGASGNAVTEDLVFMFEAMGLNTGIDLEALAATRRFIAEHLPEDHIYGHIADAGVPKGFGEVRQAAE